MNEPFIGMVQYFGFDWAPKGYTTCSGQTLSIAQNTALFSLLGTMYGGDGRTTFGLPDLRGRSVVGISNSHSQGEKFGATSVTLLTSNMPAHTHVVANLRIGAFPSSGRGGDATDPAGAYPASPSSGTQYATAAGTNEYLGAPTVIVGVAGQSTPMSTVNPYLAVTAAIALQGLFPSRN